MNLKYKAYLNAPRVKNWNRRANKLARKYRKFEDSEKYSIDFRHKFIAKKTSKFFKILNVDLEVIGFENLPKAPAILAPNHSSLIDPILIFTSLLNPDKSPDAEDGIPLFLSKADVAKNKHAKGYASLLNTFYIDRNKPREAVKQLDEMAEFAKNNKRYSVIFPEGTRSKDGKVNEFKSGAFRTAKKTYVPIVPVTINNAPAILDFNRTGKLKVQVIFHKALKPMSFMSHDTKSIAKNVRKIVEKSWVKPQSIRASNEKKV